MTLCTRTASRSYSNGIAHLHNGAVPLTCMQSTASDCGLSSLLGDHRLIV